MDVKLLDPMGLSCTAISCRTAVFVQLPQVEAPRVPQ